MLPRLLPLFTLASACSLCAAPTFRSWAPTPPMGWNSWDCFATTVTETQTKAHADYMAANLLSHGWEYVVVDIQWYEPNATGYEYRKDAALVTDEFGRLLPAVNKFPSSAQGVGFKTLSDYVHSKGLKFGIHLMRGIPRQAVRENHPIKGTPYHAADIADKINVCTWNSDMYGVDMSKPGAQEYYDSVFQLIADWGVDFVKVDDLSRPYLRNMPEIEAIRKAIDKTGRPMVLSLSPGETDLQAGEHVMDHANMWRISDDFWDSWPMLFAQFRRLHNWEPYTAPGAYPDADMIPFGTVQMGRKTHFTPPEHYTLMTLWSIARSPLMFGGDLTKMDDFTLSFLTNDEVLAINQHSTHNRQLFRTADNRIGWVADVPGSADKYLALFNASDEFDLSGQTPVWQSEVISRNTPKRSVPFSVELHGASRLSLVANDADGSISWDHAIWVDPVVELANGDTIDLSRTPWAYGHAGYGEINTRFGSSGQEMSLNGHKLDHAIAAHANSMVAFQLPPNAVRVRGTAAIDDIVLTQKGGATVRFAIYATQAPEHSANGREIPVDLSYLGFTGNVAVRDLWKHEDVGTFSGTFAPVIEDHGAGLYRVSPVR